MVDPRTIGERVPEISEHQVKVKLLNFETHMHTTPCHVESEKQTEIQVAGLCERPGDFLFML